MSSSCDSEARCLLELSGVSLHFRPSNAPTSLKSAVLQRLTGRSRAALPGSYGALHDIDLDLRPGERLAVLGANGAGKTTLLRLLCGVYPPTSGRVRRRGFIVPLLQLGLGFNPELSGRENVFLAAAFMRIPRRAIASRIDGIFEFCGLEDARSLPLKYYSTGMAARLAFAVATEVTPEILLLDEIFAVGDAHWIQRATDRMERLLERTPILALATHDLTLARRFCNRAILLEGGRLVLDGKVEEVSEHYRRGHSAFGTE